MLLTDIVAILSLSSEIFFPVAIKYKTYFKVIHFSSYLYKFHYWKEKEYGAKESGKPNNKLEISKQIYYDDYS